MDHARSLLDNDAQASLDPASPYLQHAPHVSIIGLMAGVNPAFMAGQLGHSPEMFFRVYAKWIRGQHDERELAKIELAISEVLL
jgi:integrase